MQVWSCGPVVSPWAIPSALVGDRSICGNLMVSGQVSCGSLTVPNGTITASNINCTSLVVGSGGIVLEGNIEMVSGQIQARDDISTTANLVCAGIFIGGVNGWALAPGVDRIDVYFNNARVGSLVLGP